MRIEFFIDQRVKPKQSFCSGGKGGHGFTDKKTKANAKSLAFWAAKHRPSVPMAGPLCVEYVFQYPWRKAEPRKNRTLAKAKDTGADCDNLAKQMNDVLESVGFFANDSQIAELIVRKVWTDSPGVQVVVEEM